jgi:thioredoxin-like negative regulator of GroEL
MDAQVTQAHVGCLCAAWCRLCDDYAPVLRQVVGEFASGGTALQLHWIDIEDEADLVGDVDVETFPTIVVIGADGTVRFAGPVTPQPEAMRRLLRSTLVEPGADSFWPRLAPEIEDFALRLRHRGAA